VSDEIYYEEYEDGTLVWEDGTIEYADGTIGHVDELEDDYDEYDDADEGFGLAERVATEQGRQLTSAELERLADADERAANRGEGFVTGDEVDAALNDFSTAAGRRRAVDERFADLERAADAPATIAPLPADATREQRIAHLNARMAGATIDPNNQE
jgi:hypothetical protein